MAEDNEDAPEVIEMPIDGVLDLHGVRPAEVGDMVIAYLDACVERGIFQVRIIHGKGIGNLRRTVHARLERSPLVVRFALADEGAGGWGATLVELAGPDPIPPAA